MARSFAVLPYSSPYMHRQRSLGVGPDVWLHAPMEAGRVKDQWRDCQMIEYFEQAADLLNSVAALKGVVLIGLSRRRERAYLYRVHTYFVCTYTKYLVCMYICIVHRIYIHM